MPICGSVQAVNVSARQTAVGIVLALLVGAAAMWFHHRRSDESAGFPRRETTGMQNGIALMSGGALEARESEIDATVWAREILAQKCGRTFEDFWDSINSTTEKFRVVAGFPVGKLVLARYGKSESGPCGVELWKPAEPMEVLTSKDWQKRVRAWGMQGWRLVQTEFRHVQFDVDESGAPRQSRFWFSAHLNNDVASTRAIVEGDLIVDWCSQLGRGQTGIVQRIDASRLVIKTRHGPPMLAERVCMSIPPPAKARSIDPLILYDLDRDGRPEIILVSANLVFRLLADGRYESRPLCQYPPDGPQTAVIADFDGDGFADLLCAVDEGLILYPGDGTGTFDVPARPAWLAGEPLRNAMSLTCGDIDDDGDLDLFLAQYKVPTVGQVLRPNYYEANDGHPAFLLINDGHGEFMDATEGSGLEPLRWQRTFSASFVDMDRDGHLDLLKISDFSGVNLYRNDGTGKFADMTGAWVSARHAFGMSHSIADFNSDGLLDFLMVGMNSPTVDRLEHLGLVRQDARDTPEARREMTVGNRLFIARESGGFEQPALDVTLAKAGWSWSAAAFELDNDGLTDLYFVTGHDTRRSVREYEPEFWLHDIHVDETVDPREATAYFLNRFTRRRQEGWSYGGYEKNKLFVQQGGFRFMEIAHLAGAALEADSRNVVAADIDLDGWQDLVLTTYEVWPETKQTLRIYLNKLSHPNRHWIGFEFREQAGKPHPIGAVVTIHAGSLRAVKQLVTGEGLRSQAPCVLHFGLGEIEKIERAEIQWHGGPKLVLEAPAVDKYHRIEPPTCGDGRRAKAL